LPRPDPARAAALSPTWEPVAIDPAASHAHLPATEADSSRLRFRVAVALAVALLALAVGIVLAFRDGHADDGAATSAPVERVVADPASAFRPTTPGAQT
jgi:hypothetical protein